MSESDEDVIISETDDAGTDRADDADAPQGADALGDAGKKALDAMKAKWQKERDARKALEDRIAAADTKDGDQPDPEKIREQARAEARAEVLRERVLDRVEAKAAKLFADPEDARALLAKNIDDFIDDGQVDTDAIQEALDDLLKRKPHLAAMAAKRFTGSADGGARKGSGKPTQLTEHDLKRMTPQQIDAARVAGQLDDLMGVS